MYSHSRTFPSQAASTSASSNLNPSSNSSFYPHHSSLQLQSHGRNTQLAHHSSNLPGSSYSVQPAASSSGARLPLPHYQSFDSVTSGQDGWNNSSSNLVHATPAGNNSSSSNSNNHHNHSHNASASASHQAIDNGGNRNNGSPRGQFFHSESMQSPERSRSGAATARAATARSDFNYSSSNRSSGLAAAPSAPQRPVEHDPSPSLNVHGRFHTQQQQSQQQQPNWGLFGRQLSQIAGDVSTSVRQNEILVGLLERLVDRIENSALAAALVHQQADDGVRDSMGGGTGESSKAAYAIGRPPGSSHRGRNSASFLILDPAPVLPHHRDSVADVRQQPPPPFVSLMPALAQHTANSHTEASHSTAAHVSYLDQDLGTHSFDFISPSQNLGSTRSQYITPLHHHHRFDSAGALPKRTPPNIPLLLSNNEAPPLPSPAQGHQYSPSIAIANGRERDHQDHQTALDDGVGAHERAHLHSTGDNTNAEASQDENYNRIPSPVFPDSAPADEEPPAGMGFGSYYQADEELPTPQEEARLDHQQPLTSPSISRNREESRSRTLGGMGSLEDAGIVPASSISSVNVTPAPHQAMIKRLESFTEAQADNMEDDSAMDLTMQTMPEDDRSEPANDDWKLWLEPRQSNRRDLPRAKYRTAKQVKMDRKEKTKRSLSTIGRIPLKEYLEVGSDYKMVRRAARSVYNTWLALNVRLAKQDPERLIACYHKLEYDFPILADCEEHWKAKELMLQVIDNAIDEIAFHRRKEERRHKDNTKEASEPAPSASDGGRNLRRDATAADLYTNEDTRPLTRRRRGALSASQHSQEPDDEMVNGSAQYGGTGEGGKEANQGFNNYGPQGILTRSALNQQQQQSWNQTEESEANMFAQTNGYDQAPESSQQQQAHQPQQHHITTRGAHRRSSQINNSALPPNVW